MQIIENFKGRYGESVGIFKNEYANAISYVAVTKSTSKTFKSEKGAYKFLEKYGYR